MTFGREADHRVVLTDAIYHKGAEDGLCGRTKSFSHRARQTEMESCMAWWVACQMQRARVHNGSAVGLT